MATTSEAFRLAQQYHRSGDPFQAEPVYRHILHLDPCHAQAWFLLGALCQASGRLDESVGCYRQAVQLQPHFAEAHNNLGVALDDQGKWDEALTCYHKAVEHQPAYAEALNNLGLALLSRRQTSQAIAYCQKAPHLRPDYAKAHNNLGLALAAEGKLDEALACYARAASLQPGYAEAHVNRGVCLAEQGKLDEAIASYQEALRLNPESAEAQNNLGLARALQGKRDEARQHYCEALRRKPDYPEALNNLGELLQTEGRFEEALALHQRALQLSPEYVDGLNSLGNVLSEKGQWQEAASCYQQAVGLNPHSAEALNNLGLALESLGKVEESLASYEQAVRLKPNYAEALNNLANAYKDQGRLDEALARYQQAIARKPADASLHSNLLFALHYDPDCTAEAIFAEHQRWAQQHADPLAAKIQPHELDCSPGRRLRIGYLSPDFRQHVVASFIEPILSAHDHERFEITCYANVARPDRVTERLQRYADRWRSLVGLSDAEAAQQIRQDRIDILVDLAGHTGGNRLLVCAHQPAPIHVTYLGYPDTTGLAAIDYRITDAVADPPGMTETYHTEQLLRLPRIQWCYRPPVSPERKDVPALQTGLVTFGSLNSLAKVSAQVIGVWSRILHAQPDARLLLVTGAGREGDQRVLVEFARQGIDNKRMTLLSKRPYEQYLRLYHEVDICLDSFPFSGCTTTCDALWMGVPVITLAGKTCVSRQGVSLLSHVGLPELIAATPDAYVEIALRLAGDLGKLRELRKGLRNRMSDSIVTDAYRFTRNLEAAYRWMWQRL